MVLLWSLCVVGVGLVSGAVVQDVLSLLLLTLLFPITLNFSDVQEQIFDLRFLYLGGPIFFISRLGDDLTPGHGIPVRDPLDHVSSESPFPILSRARMTNPYNLRSRV